MCLPRGCGVYHVTCDAYRDTPPPVNRITDRCKKHYLPATSFAGGNKLRFRIKTRLILNNELTGLVDSHLPYRDKQQYGVSSAN